MERSEVRNHLSPVRSPFGEPRADLACRGEATIGEIGRVTMRWLASLFLVASLICGSTVFAAASQTQGSSVADRLPDFIPLDYGECFRVDRDSAFDFPTL